MYLSIVSLDLLVALRDLPQFDGLVVGGEEEVGLVLAAQPSDLVDLLLDFERLQVVELGLVRLERRVHVVLAALRDRGL